jgi:hypothetical protein
MTDFLTFLNTADLDTLTKIPGVSRKLAASIIEARPFDFVEDALHVKGMGKNLLGRVQSYFEAELNDSESRAMVTVEEEAAPVPVEKIQPTGESAYTRKPSFFARLGRSFLNILWGVIKILIVLTLGAIIGGVAYYVGFPLLYQRFIAPVDRNTARLNGLAEEVDALTRAVEDLEPRLNNINLRVDALDEAVQAQTESLAQLGDMQTKLEKELESGNSILAQELKREIMHIRSIEFLSRARLYLAQSNFGLAREDVLSARDLLVQLRKVAPEYQLIRLDEIITFLDMALENLPAFPVIAVNHVDIAWQLLMNGLPESAAEAAITPTMESTPTLTATQTSLATQTPTATP